MTIHIKLMVESEAEFSLEPLDDSFRMDKAVVQSSIKVTGFTEAAQRICEIEIPDVCAHQYCTVLYACYHPSTYVRT